jgi:S1-C subfamily serine protease
MKLRIAIRRGVPVAAALVVLAAGCGVANDTEDRPDSAGAGEETRAPAEAVTEPPAAPSTTAQRDEPAQQAAPDQRDEPPQQAAPDQRDEPAQQAAPDQRDEPAQQAAPDQRDEPDGDRATGTGAPAATDDECSFQTTMSGIEGSVFQIILDGSAGPELGTAFSIGGGEYLTAAHLVADHTSARLRNAVADFPVTVTGSDPVRDVTLLRGDGPAGAGLPLHLAADVQPGQSVASVGYPLFEEYRASITGGLVSRLTEDRDLGLLIQTDTPINRGNSGGPLVDRCGRVVGMIVEKWFETGVEGLAWAIASNSLETAIAELRSGLISQTPSGAVDAADLRAPAVPAPSSETPPVALLDELATLIEGIEDRIEAAGRYFDSGQIDAATQEQALWHLAEAADQYRNVVSSDAYHLGDSGRSCDLARRAYARALGWMSRWAGYLAAEAWSPGQYDAEVAEALRRTGEIADEATDHRHACAAGR